MGETGYKVVAISDIHGGIYNPKGLDIPDVMSYMASHKTFERYQNAEPVSNHQLLEIDCEVLLPAATENQITSHNAHRIKCRDSGRRRKNGPTTAAADDILESKGVFVIPDILANAGGVTCSYFEWVQDRMGYFWKEEMVNERLKDVMVASFNGVVEYRENHGVNNASPPTCLAVTRSIHPRWRGIYA